MNKRRLALLAGLLLLAALAFGLVSRLRPARLVLTGLVTTDEVIVSAEIGGRLERLDVRPGDAVQRGQVLGEIAPAETRADLAYYENVERGAAAQVEEADAALRFQEELTARQVAQAEAALAAAEAVAHQAEADLDLAEVSFARAESLRRQGANSAQDFDQARTARAAAAARAAAQRQQAAAARAALDVARAGAAQVAVRRSALDATRRQLAAAAAQREKAGVRLGYTAVRAPAAGIVNVRAALPGEVVAAGQPIVTLVDPDDLWVRADVEETYLERIRLGDRLTVRLPSGDEREGTVFFRGVDADYATQRDVSRTKRDIRTFEIRLRCDNRDRRLAVGLTAYVVLPLAR
jgi:multidrug resistance efflux pump